MQGRRRPINKSFLDFDDNDDELILTKTGTGRRRPINKNFLDDIPDIETEQKAEVKTEITEPEEKEPGRLKFTPSLASQELNKPDTTFEEDIASFLQGGIEGQELKKKYPAFNLPFDVLQQAGINIPVQQEVLKPATDEPTGRVLTDEEKGRSQADLIKQLRKIVETEKRLGRKPTKEEAEIGDVEHILKSFANVFPSQIGDAVTALGTLAQFDLRYRGLAPQLQQLGREISSQQFTVNPYKEGDFLKSTLPQAFGSGILFYGTGALGRLAKLPTYLLPVMTASLPAAQQGYDEAKQKGADEQTAITSFFINMGIGASEVAPVINLFKRLDKKTGGQATRILSQRIREIISEGGEQAFEEWIQETASQFAKNLTAKGLYDVSRELDEGLMEGGAAGLITGFFMGAAGRKAQQLLQDKNLSDIDRKLLEAIPRELSKEEELAIDKFVREELLSPERAQITAKPNALEMLEEEQQPAPEVSENLVEALTTEMPDISPEVFTIAQPETEADEIAKIWMREEQERERVLNEERIKAARELKTKKKEDRDSYSQLSQQVKRARRKNNIIDEDALQELVNRITTPEIKQKAENLLKEAALQNQKIRERSEFTLENLSKRKFGTRNINSLTDEQQQDLLNEYNELRKQGIRDFGQPVTVTPILKGREEDAGTIRSDKDVIEKTAPELVGEEDKRSSSEDIQQQEPGEPGTPELRAEEESIEEEIEDVGDVEGVKGNEQIRDYINSRVSKEWAEKSQSQPIPILVDKDGQIYYGIGKHIDVINRNKLSESQIDNIEYSGWLEKGKVLERKTEGSFKLDNEEFKKLTKQSRRDLSKDYNLGQIEYAQKTLDKVPIGDPNRGAMFDKLAKEHKEIVTKAIQEGKIKSHPDYPELKPPLEKQVKSEKKEEKKKPKRKKFKKEPASLTEALLDYLVSGGTVKPTKDFPKSSLYAMGIQKNRVSERGVSPEFIFESIAPELWEQYSSPFEESKSQSELFEEILYKYDTHQSRKKALQELRGEIPVEPDLTDEQLQEFEKFNRLDEIILTEYLDPDGNLRTDDIIKDSDKIIKRAKVDETDLFKYLKEERGKATYEPQEYEDVFGEFYESEEITNERAKEIIETADEKELEELAEDIERQAESTKEAELNQAVEKADELTEGEEEPTEEPPKKFSRERDFDSDIKNLQNQINEEQQAMFPDEGKIADLNNRIKKLRMQKAQVESQLGLEAEKVKKEKTALPKSFNIDEASLQELRNYREQLEQLGTDKEKRLLERVRRRIEALENRGEQGGLFEPEQGSLKFSQLPADIKSLEKELDAITKQLKEKGYSDSDIAYFRMFKAEPGESVEDYGGTKSLTRQDTELVDYLREVNSYLHQLRLDESQKKQVEEFGQPALRMPDGTVVTNSRSLYHRDIYEQIPVSAGINNISELERGFLKDGYFRTPQDAVEDKRGVKPEKIIDYAKLREAGEALLTESITYTFNDSKVDIKVSRALEKADYSSVKKFAQSMSLPERLNFLWEIADKLGIKINYRSLADVTTGAVQGAWDDSTGEDIIIINRDWFASDRFQRTKLANQAKSDKQGLTSTVVHEILHALQESPRLRDKINFKKDLEPELRNIANDVKKQLTEDYEAIKENANRARYIRLEYQLERAIDDPSELLTLALTDPVFARYLDTIPYTGKDAKTGETIWTKIKDWVRSLAERIGIGKTQLDRLTDLLDDVYRRAGLLDEQGNFVSPGEYLNQAFGKQSKFLSEEEGFANPFYSQMQVVLERKLPNLFNKEMINNILNSGEIKKAEIEWSGINEWLSEQQGKINKEDLLNFLKANEFMIEEVSKGDKSKEYGDVVNKLKKSGITLAEFPDGTNFYNEDGEVIDLEDMSASQKELVRKYFNEKEKNRETKYSQWTLPGGENYRELLFTLSDLTAKQSKRFDELDKQIDLLEEQKNKLPYNSPEREKIVKQIDALMPEWESLRFTEKPEFKSSHFDEPNIIAHARVDDRIDADGKKVLFIEEIQSDWALEGRKKGYAPKELNSIVENKIKEKQFHIKPHRNEATIIQDKNRYSVRYNVIANGKLIKTFFIREYGNDESKTLSAAEEFKKTLPKTVYRIEDLEGKYYTDYLSKDEAGKSLKDVIAKQSEIIRRSLTENLIPDFPFKNNWHEFVLKNLLRKASEEGYDKVAWITGEQTAERYDLSKHIDTLDWNPKTGDLYGSKGTENKITQRNVSQDKLAEYVGKEVAQKLIETEAHPKSGHKILKGIELKVGGEWAKTLYDKVIPNFLNKYAKKWGAKVGESEIKTGSGTDWKLKETDKGFAIVDENGHNIDIPPTYYKNKAEGELRLSQTIEGMKTKVHSLDITPSMKQAVLYEGQPKFLEEKSYEQPNTLQRGIEHIRELRAELGEKADIYPEWAKRMVRDFGYDVRKELRGLWRLSKQEVKTSEPAKQKPASASPEKLESRTPSSPKETKPVKVKEEFTESDLNDVKRLREIGINLSNDLSYQIGSTVRTNLIKRLTRGAIGVFFPGSGIVRVRNINDVSTLAHELGHKLDFELFDIRGSLKFDKTNKIEGAITRANGIKDPARRQKILDNLRKQAPDVFDTILERAELRKELKKFTRAIGHYSDKTEEGIAEFISRYVVEPDTAKNLAPMFHNFFEKLLKANPEIKKALLSAREQMKEYNEQDPRKITESTIMREDDKNRWLFGIKKFFDKEGFYYNVIDGTKPFRDLEKKLLKQDPNLPGIKNPLLQVLSLIGVDGKAKQYLENHPFVRKGNDIEIKKNQKGLFKIFEKMFKDGTLKSHEGYLVALRNIELYNNGKGAAATTSKNIAEQTVKLYEEQLGKKYLENLVSSLRDYNNTLLEYYKDSGKISEEQLEEIKELNKYYVPFKRYFSEWESTGSLPNVSKYVKDSSPSPVKRIKGSLREVISPVGSMIKNTYDLIAAADRNTALATIVKSLRAINKEFVQEIPARVVKHRQVLNDQGELEDRLSVEFEKPSNAEIVTVWQDGKPSYYQIPKEYYDSFFSISEPVTRAIRILSLPSRILQAGAVGYDPTFAVRNVARDQVSASFYTKYGYNPLDFFKGMFTAIGKKQEYQKFLASGADQSFLTAMDKMLSKQYVAEKAGNRIQTSWQKYKKNPLSLFQDFNRATELGTRVGGFRKAYLKTGDVYKAMQEGREIAADYGVKGKAMSSVSPLYPFLNARLQHLKMTGQTIKNNPAKFLAKGFLFITVPSILNWFLNHTDDEREKLYNELPEWRRYGMWNIPIPGTDSFVPVPKGFFGQLFGTTTEALLDYFRVNDPETLKSLAEELFVELSPMSNPVDIIPQFGRPVVEQFANRQGYTGNPIVSMKFEGIETTEQYTEFTSEFAKAIGELSGISPLRVDAFIKSYTAGAGRGVLQITDEILELAGITEPSGEDTFTKLSQLPLTRAFVTETPLGTRGRSVEDFYKKLDELEVINKTVNNYIKLDDLEKAEKYLDGRENDYKFYLKNQKEINRFKDVLRAVRELKKEILKDPDIKNKRETIKIIENEVTDVAIAFNEAFNKKSEFSISNYLSEILQSKKDRDKLVKSKRSRFKSGYENTEGGFETDNFETEDFDTESFETEEF